MTLEDATCAARAGMRRMLVAAQLQGVCVAFPLLGQEGQEMVQGLFDLLSDEEPAAELTMEERYGAEFTADYEGVQRRLKEWLQKRRTPEKA